MSSTASSLVRDVLSIFKLRIGIAIMMSAIGGVAITPGDVPALWKVAVLSIAVFLASASAGAFNQWAEADLDRTMKRTANRPFASGRFHAGAGWLAAILGLLAVAVVMAFWAANGWAAFHTFMGAFVYGIVYTIWLKRRSWTNIVVGGLAGSFAVLAGAAAVGSPLQPAPLLLAIVVFLWTPPHFWSLAIAYRDDYEAAGVPMLPVVKGDVFAARAVLAHAIVLVALSLALALLAPGPVYFVCAAVGGWLFVRRALDLLATPDRAHALRCFHASLIQLSLVLVGVMLDAGARAALEG